jgi:hypothetical protein
MQFGLNMECDYLQGKSESDAFTAPGVPGCSGPSVDPGTLLIRG